MARDDLGAGGASLPRCWLGSEIVVPATGSRRPLTRCRLPCPPADRRRVPKRPPGNTASPIAPLVSLLLADGGLASENSRQSLIKFFAAQVAERGEDRPFPANQNRLRDAIDLKFLRQLATEVVLDGGVQPRHCPLACPAILDDVLGRRGQARAAGRRRSAGCQRWWWSAAPGQLRGPVRKRCRKEHGDGCEPDRSHEVPPSAASRRSPIDIRIPARTVPSQTERNAQLHCLGRVADPLVTGLVTDA